MAKQTDPAKKTPGPVYAGVVVWLACFLVGAVLLVEPVQGYIVGATVTPSKPLNPKELKSLVHKIEQRAAGAADSEHHHLPITAAVREVGGKSVIDLTLITSQQSHGKQQLADFLRLLSRELSHSGQSDSRIETAAEADGNATLIAEAEKLQLLVANAEKSLADSQKAVTAAFDSFSQETASQVAAIAPKDPQPEESATPQPVDEYEARLDRLRSQVGFLQERFNELNRRLTPAHPEIVNAGRRLQEAQRELDAALRAGQPGARAYLSDGELNPPATAQNLVNNQYVNDSGSSPERYSEFVQWLYAEQKSLKVKAENTVDISAKLTAIHQQTKKLIESTKQSEGVFATSGSTPVLTVLSEPHLAERLGGSMSLTRVLGLGLVALIIAAGVVYLLGRGGAPLKLFQNVESVEELGLPILGVVSPSTAKIAPPLEKPSKLAPWTLRGCEVALGALVVMFALYALTNSMTTNSAVHDPLGTLAEMAWQMRRMVING